MYNLEINIGLNVGNVEPNNQLSKTVEGLRELFNYDYRVEEGTWDGIWERVLVVRVAGADIRRKAVEILLGSLCSSLSQEAIAFELNGFGGIVYNTTYEGEKYEFKEEYFKNF